VITLSLSSLFISCNPRQIDTKSKELSLNGNCLALATRKETLVKPDFSFLFSAALIILGLKSTPVAMIPSFP